MTYETISISTDDRGVATLLLDRADKHNAMSAQMIEELTDAAHALGADEAVRVVVLTGAGKSFCAGGDLRWMQDQMAADPVTRGIEAKKLAMMLCKGKPSAVGSGWRRCPMCPSASRGPSLA